MRLCFAALTALLLTGVVHADAPSTVKAKHKVTDTIWRDYAVRTVGSLPSLPAADPPLDRFGGRTDRKADATGYFHVRKEGDRFYLVDPQGGLFLHVGVDAVDPGPSSAAFTDLFDTPANWAAKTTDLLHASGFNGAGSWSRTELLRVVKPTPLVYTIMGNGGGGGFMAAFGHKLKVTRPGTGHTAYPNDCLPLFHPDFAAFCDDFARPIAKNAADPLLLGYFSDNEMPMPKLDNYLKLPPDDPAMGSTYHAAKAWLDARKGKDALPADITDADREAWIDYAYDRYLTVTTDATRKYDPRHLCLGPRFYGGEKRHEGTWKAAGRHLDAIAVNHYGSWDPSATPTVAQYTAWSGKPVIVSEFYAKGIDSGFANTGGAGWVVATQNDRGLFYETFTLGLLQLKTCVGWHWFKYRDNDPNDRASDPSNTDSNKGLVTVAYVPYAPLADHMRAVNRRVYALADWFDRGRK
jgi:hypothetical protein